MEYPSFSMILTASILYEVEYSNRKVKVLLADATQSEQDLQFIAVNGLDIILIVDTLASYNLGALKLKKFLVIPRSRPLAKSAWKICLETTSPMKLLGPLTSFTLAWKASKAGLSWWMSA